MQCAGRAGRRGIDTIGHVIHCNNLFDIPHMNDYKIILCGTPQTLISSFRITYQLILHLLHTNRDFKDFMEKSMMGLEIKDQQTCLSANMIHFETRMLQKKEIQMKTSMEDLEKYFVLKKNYEYLNHKKRKEVDREMLSIKEKSKTYYKDLDMFNDIKKIEKDYELENSNYLYHTHYIENQTKIVCTILENDGYIVMNDNDEKYVLTSRGSIASRISEIHCLIGAEMLTKWNFFQEFTTEQILNLLSCFTDIKVEDDYRKDYPLCDDEFLKNKIIDLQKTISMFQEREDNMKMDSHTNYDDMLQFNLLDKMEDWYYAENEEQCKEFIQVKLQEMNISV